MFNFDIPTLRLIGLILVSSALLALVLFLFWRSQSIRSGAQYWVLGILCYILAFIVATTFQGVPIYKSVSVIFDACLVGSGLLFLHGTRVTLQKKSLLKYELAILAIATIVSCYYIYIDPNSIIRIRNLSILTAIVALWTSLTLLKSTGEKRPPPVVASAIVFIIYAIYNVYKASYITFAEVINPDFLAITFLSSSLFVCAISLTFILMAYHVLEHELIDLIDTIKSDSEIRLHDAEERWILALEYSNAGAWEWDLNNHSMNFSNQWKKMAGYRDNEICGPTNYAEKFIHPDDRKQVTEDLNKLINGESSIYEGEHRIARKDGSWLWVLSRGKITQFSDNNTPLKIIGTDTDISLQKNNEARLKMAIAETRKNQEAADLANRAKTTFLTNMSHEIRTPMNAILGFSQLLIDDPNISENQMDSLSIISKSGEHLLSLIDDILDLSRIESGNFTLLPETTPLTVLLKDVSNFFSNRPIKEHVTFELDFCSTLPSMIMLDPKALRQILTNLLANAFKFTNAGKIHFEVFTTTTEAHGTKLTANVSDTGVGIAEDDYGLIFSAFEQTEVGKMTPEGTGLGLAISKNLANLMGGDLTFTSELGRGSCFTLELPITSISETINTETIPKSHKFVQLEKLGTKLLVIDDIESNRLLLKRQLGNLGFTIMEAGSAEKGLQLIESWKPALVLMDIKMPGMSGDQAIIEIRKNPKNADLPIIVVTANVLEGERERLIHLGANDFISKPFQKGEILDKVSAQLKINYHYSAKQIPKPVLIEMQDNQAFQQPQAVTKILVVDDNFANQQLLQSQLQSLGYDTEIASNGKEALLKWRTQHYPLVFSDCAMPIMDGFEMTTLIREEEKDQEWQQRTRIIAITGSADEYKEQCQRCKMDDILAKPLLINELKQALEKHLNSTL